jgi:hypothetical protein
MVLGLGASNREAILLSQGCRGCLGSPAGHLGSRWAALGLRHMAMLPLLQGAPLPAAMGKVIAYTSILIIPQTLERALHNHTPAVLQVMRLGPFTIGEPTHHMASLLVIGLM